MGFEQIEHIVLVMMENRSFDHYLGALDLPPENRGEIDGLGHGPSPESAAAPVDLLGSEYRRWW